MPRRSKGARLYLRRRCGRATVWVILDQGREISTGAGQNDIGAAEEALAAFIGDKRRPDFGEGHPAQVLIADALSEYGDTHAPTTRRPQLIGCHQQADRFLWRSHLSNYNQRGLQGICALACRAD